MAKMGTLQDSFTVNDLASKWAGPNHTGIASVAGGRLVLPCTLTYTGVSSTAQYDLTASYAFACATPDTGGTSYQNYMQLWINSSNYAQIGWENGSVHAQLLQAGVLTGASVTYDPAAHRWWRIREAGGTLFFETSPDSLTWTAVWSSTYTITLTAMYAVLYSGHFSAGTDGTAYFTSFNVPAGAYLIQSAPGSVTAPSGIGTTAISTSAGSFLAAFIGWNCVTPGTSAAVPSVSVTDSAGNLWQQCALTRTGASSTRAAIWCAANTLPVTWISVGLSGNAASASWTATEIGGMPQDVQPDFSVSVNSGGTAPSLSWQASQPGIGLAVLGAGNSAETVTAAPAGWAAAGTATASGGTAGTRTFAWWAPAVAAGSAVTALTLGTAASWSYALCSLKAAASPPAPLGQFYPRVTVEAAFGAQPGNIASSQDWLFSDDYTTWTDITTRVLGPNGQGRIKTSRGRPYQLQQQEAGQMSATLANWDGAFTPTNPAGQFYSTALNANMSFQSSVSPWTPRNGAALGQSTAAVFASGLNAAAAFSAQATCGTAASPGIASELVPVNPNYPYTPSAWLYAGSAWVSGGQVGLNWYTSGQSLILGTFATAAALPAGQWTQMSLPGQVPPSGAAYAQVVSQLAGIPGAGFTFSVAEAALAAGSRTVRTGLVAPLTPVRVTAWWLGRRYPVWMGYAMAWPQEWPDLPQWGFSTLKAGDALALAAAGSMYSALSGEILADSPYAYLPCSESYMSAVAGATAGQPFIWPGGYFIPADASGLPAVNRAPGNQKTGTYLDGEAQQAQTGAAINFLGDSGTGTGATGYSGAVTGVRGPSVLYEDPQGLIALSQAAQGFTVEFWVNYSGTGSCTFLTLYGPPSAYTTSGASPQGAFLTCFYNQPGANLIVLWGGTPTSVPFTPSQSPQQVVLVFSGSGTLASIYLNGSLFGSASGTPFSGTALRAVVLGPGQYSCDADNMTSYHGANFAAGQLAVYGYQLPAGRVSAHYQAGAAGWSGMTGAARFSQLLTWAQLAVKRGGYDTGQVTGFPESTKLGPAYGLAGQPAAAAAYALAQSEGGRYGTQANGAVAYRERPSQYNQAAVLTFGGGTAASRLLNPDPGFTSGGAGWTASGGTVTAGGPYGPWPGVTFVPAGTAAVTATSPQFAFTGGSAIAGFWVNAPGGGTAGVTVQATWYAGGVPAGTASAVPPLPAGAWAFAPLAFSAAGTGITAAALTVQASAAAAGPGMQVAWAAMWNSGPVSYQPKSSYGFDMTYIYNDVTATQQSGAAQLATYDARGTASIAQYSRRSALSFQPAVASPYDASDLAGWSLAGYQQPSVRAAEITVNAVAEPLEAFTAILSLDTGQVVQVNRNPVGGAPLAETATAERVAHDIGPGFWQAAFQASPYGPAQAILSADTAGADVPASVILAW